jgi:hypothetical protein
MASGTSVKYGHSAIKSVPPKSRHYRADESGPLRVVKIGEASATYSTYLDETVLDGTTYLHLGEAVYRHRMRSTSI